MAATYEPIATFTVSTAQSSYTFSSIPQTYTDLYVVISSYEGSSGASLGVQFNGDTGNNYCYTFTYGDGSGGTGSQKGNNAGSIYVGQINGGTVSLLNINNYSNTTTYKNILTRNGATAQSVFTAIGTWQNTNAITSLTISRGGNFTVGSTFTIYGIKAA